MTFVTSPARPATSASIASIAGPPTASRSTTSAKTGSARHGPSAALTDAVARFAAALEDLGVTKGDRVAIYASNVPESFIAIHACYRIGAIYSRDLRGIQSVRRPRSTRGRSSQGRGLYRRDAPARQGRAAQEHARRSDERAGDSPRRRRASRRHAPCAPEGRARLRGAPRPHEATRGPGLPRGERAWIYHLHLGHDVEAEGTRARRYRVLGRRLREREVVFDPDRERRVLVHRRRRVG